MKAFSKPGVAFLSFGLLLAAGITVGLAGVSLAKDAVKHVEAGEYGTEVLKSKQPVFIDFYAEWCRPCKMLAPTVEELSAEYQGKVKFVKVDIDKAPSVAQMYGITAVPTMIIINKGKKVKALTGLQSKEKIKAFISKNLPDVK